MNADELEQNVAVLGKMTMQLQALTIFQQCQIQVLKDSLVSMALDPKAGAVARASLMKGLDDKISLAVHQHLAELADKDAGHASYLRKILEKGLLDS